MGAKGSKIRAVRQDVGDQIVNTSCLKNKLTGDTVSMRNLYTYLDSCYKENKAATQAKVIEPFEIPCFMKMNNTQNILLIIFFVLIVAYLVYLYKFKN